MTDPKDCKETDCCGTPENCTKDVAPEAAKIEVVSGGKCCDEKAATTACCDEKTAA